MAQNPNSSQIDSLIERADIVQIASALGLHIDARRTDPRQAICPFHNDKAPSLSLYSGKRSASDRPHYHCYACGAHGDVIELIERRENLDFPAAIARLAEIMGETIERRPRRLAPTLSGAVTLSEAIKNQDPANAHFVSFAESRGYDPRWLQEAGTAILDLSSFVTRARNERDFEEALAADGIARRREDQQQDTLPSLAASNLRGFFRGSRFVFQINGRDGRPAGFAARALQDEKPKYLYSYGFARRETLYRADRVLAKLDVERTAHLQDPVEVFLVEGLFDALRLESLGFNAVAVLGAGLTAHQISVLSGIISAAENCDRKVHLHIYFDRDEAGRRGAYDASIAILRLAAEHNPLSLDIVWPAFDSEGIALPDGKVDPDSALRTYDTATARTFINNAAISPLEFLFAYWQASAPRSVDWSSISRLEIASTARRIAMAFDNDWPRVASLLEIGGPTWSYSGELIDLIGRYSDPQSSIQRQRPTLQTFKEEPDDSARLLLALSLGRSSTSRREYPLDDASWDRLATAASTFSHIHRLRLESADGPAAPSLTKETPKGGGRYRLKSGPMVNRPGFAGGSCSVVMRPWPHFPAQHNTALRLQLAGYSRSAQAVCGG